MASLLLVEDHDVLSGIVAGFLREQGDHVAVVQTGEAALEALSHLAVDLVLVDVSLPGMSGIDLVAAIGQHAPDLPCLMLSGHNDRDYVRRALDAGARGYVAKGDPPALLEAVRRVLDGEIYLSEELR